MDPRIVAISGELKGKEFPLTQVGSRSVATPPTQSRLLTPPSLAGIA